MKLLKLSPGFILIIGLLIVLFSSTVQADEPFGSNLNVCPAPINPVTPVNPTIITTCTRSGSTSTEAEVSTVSASALKATQQPE